MTDLPRILSGAHATLITPPREWHNRWRFLPPHRPPGEQYLLVIDDGALLGFVVWRLYDGQWKMRIDPTFCRCLLVLAGLVADTRPGVEKVEATTTRRGMR